MLILEKIEFPMNPEYLEDEMLHARMIGNDYEQEEVKALNEIEEHVKENHLRKISPYYHIINEINDYYWIDIKVKVMETRG